MSLSRTRYRKRVQAYNDALNAGTSHDSEMTHFVRVSDSVGDIAETPDDTSVLGLRAKLVHEASNAPVAGKRAHEAKSGRASRRIPPASGPRRKAVAVLASSVVALGSLGVLSGSVNALPGQTLYPVKRGFENSRIALAQEPATLGERHLDLAARRLDEAKQLTLSEGNARLITKTLSAFTAEVDKGAELLFEAYGQSLDNGTIERVATSLTAASEVLNDLSRTVPDASGQAYESAAETVYELHAKTTNMCPGAILIRWPSYRQRYWLMQMKTAPSTEVNCSAPHRRKNPNRHATTQTHHHARIQVRRRTTSQMNASPRRATVQNATTGTAQRTTIVTILPTRTVTTPTTPMNPPVRSSDSSAL